MEDKSEQEIVEGIVKNLVDVLDCKLLVKKQEFLLGGFCKSRERLNMVKLKDLSWLIGKLEGIRIAKRMYRFEEDRCLIMRVTQLTEWEYEQFVVKGFREFYSL